MLDIGFQELLVLMVIALLVFGPDKLPELGRRLGRAMREFRRASDEFRSTVETNLNLHGESLLPPSAAPSSSTADALTPVAVPEPDPPPVGPTMLDPDGNAEAPRGLAPESLGAPEETGVLAGPREPFCTRRGARLLHRTSCAWAERTPESERIAVKTAAEGWELGLRPCPVCAPEDAVPAR